MTGATVLRSSLLACVAGFLTACGGGNEGADAPDAPSIFFSGATGPRAESSDAPAMEPVNYSDDAAWLCLPGRADVCEEDVAHTAVATDGKLTVEAFAPDPEAPIDCFYVYPTVSEDDAANSDIDPGDGERNAALHQVARFSEVCRVFAPMYRQVTLPALRAMLAGEDTDTNREMAYSDIEAAWTHYLDAYNDGRGVVLIGHSQGAGILARLLASEFTDDGARDRLVSAILVGANIEIDADRPGDGAVGGLPLCAGANQYGCLIAYTSFRSDQPPTDGALFGSATQRGHQTVCVNPAMLDGSEGRLATMLPVGRAFQSSAEPAPWTLLDEPIETPLVSLPDMLSAQCVTRNGRTFLSVTIDGDPEDVRTDDITGDIVINGEVQPGWGLHVIDINLALGNLVSLVKTQGGAWLAAHVPPDPAAAPDDDSAPTPP